MQKIIVCALALLAVVLAAPQQQPEQVYIVHQEANIHPGGYQFAYETSDGTSRQEQGSLKQIGEEQHALAVTGSYRYTAPDGLVYTVTFTADENGYKPQERVEHQQ